MSKPMRKFFSPSTVSFYDEAIHGAFEIEKPQTARERKAGKRPEMMPNPACRMPNDAVPISDAEHAALMREVAQGKQIIARGRKPIAVDQVRSAEELLAARRTQRDRLLAASDWTQLADTLADDGPLKLFWAQYRQELRDLDMTGTDWPVPPEGAEGEPS
ncbi:phage tail assembly chaperone [Blastomonas fulva]|uniref:phage tail assembly chaperone n=1 Tax=Blastomonas fulva TaxID=1550728 RepID=UPI0025A3D6DE|nr:phage tail assembly chaperone [Blastomonas fulva]MDM7928650.1 phage tail assembly chaperone [Blastomonas fulva]MDM7964436.1 phage tail assembly chaperone [Blastomonas fulva]